MADSFDPGTIEASMCDAVGGSKSTGGIDRTRRTRIWLWWSTGKDSAWALHRLRTDPSMHVERLVTTTIAGSGRVTVHGTRIEILEAQADAAGLPVERMDIPWPCPNEAYEAALAPVLDRAEVAGVEAMAFGDLFLEDVRAYREGLLAGSAIRPLFPIWGEDTASLARTMVRAGLSARVTAIDPVRLDRALLGRCYDAALLDALPPSVDPCGERGEFHTCVTGGPMLRESLEVEPGEQTEDGSTVHLDLRLR